MTKDSINVHPKYKDILGKRFGRLVVVERETVDKSSGHYRYRVKCRCDCGNIVIKEKSALLCGRAKSCGCLQRECQKSLGAKHSLPYGVAAFNATYASYKKGALNRGYEFSISKEYFKKIVIQPCIYCGESLTQEKRHRTNGMYGSFKYTGIDRYDNNKGYVEGNCVPCCKRCNRIKTDMTVKELETIINTLYDRKDFWKNPKIW